MAGSRRAQILQVAAPLFARRGFHGVSIDELGAAAGVSGPALYRHFPGKEAILAELLLDVSHRLLEGGRLQVSNRPDPPAALVALVEGHVAFALAEPALITLQARDLDAVPEPARRQVRGLQRRYVELWVETVVAVTGVEPDVALAGTHATLGLINSTPFSARLPAPAMSSLLRDAALAALGALGALAPSLEGPLSEQGATGARKYHQLQRRVGAPEIESAAQSSHSP
ncbi:TetR/AcrR family transcriptional regulator [Acidiferrimicrobium sp. IK]|uniref:TetR/AcrR family transcriptional regulator n=1 Tax=Acidiferrimicrobium sp. IK TaxID=2871700 RepID=UPI0021CB0E71|nr:TetR/AcrR family transcriptional regulator [Acidiferrimicrobium sp. IK]